MSDVLGVVVGTIGLITILAIAIYACFYDTETFKAIDKMIAEYIKSNADRKTEQTEREGE